MKKYLKKNRACFIGALIFTFISSLFAVVLQFFKGDVLDYAVAGNIKNALKFAVLLIAFILGEIGFDFCYKLLFRSKFVTRCTGQLKQDIFQQILEHGYVDYKKQPQGEYIAKYGSTADAVRDRYFNMLPLFWNILSHVILVSVALFLLDRRIALLTIALLTTPLYVPKLIEKRLQKAQEDYIKSVESTLAKINDWLSGFEIIKNFSVERKIMEKFKPANDDSMEKLLSDIRLGAIDQLLATLISYVSYFIVLAYAAWLVLKGDFTAGDFFVAIGMIDQLSFPLINLADITRELIAIEPVCKEIESFLTAPAEARTGKELKAVTGDISYQNVTFAYDEQTPILRDFSLKIEKGKRYLLKGPSGCGKTTAVNLLLRYYNVQSGSIDIDGEPIERFQSTYGSMTVVRQEATLFHDTLRNNLTMYRDIPDERLIEVLRRLNLSKYAGNDALDRVITENGANLSGGEKKRICLARALLRDTDVLILDEPLANIDSKTAERIEDLLLSIKEKTMLIVSHQFSENKLNQFERVIDFEKI